MFARICKLVLVSSLVAAPLALVPREADAALNAYLKLKGQKQGEIKGSVTQKGREGSIRVLKVSHEIVSPRDAASGLPTGKRTHKPLQVTIEIDKATPLLMQAMLSGEKFSEVSLPAFGKTKGKGGGGEVKYYEIKLQDAMITSYRIDADDDSDTPATITLNFSYKKIEWTWADGGVTASDDWEAPVVAAPARKSK